MPPTRRRLLVVTGLIVGLAGCGSASDGSTGDGSTDDGDEDEIEDDPDPTPTPEAPTVAFSFDYDTTADRRGTLTVVHDGGDRVPENRLLVRGRGFADVSAEVDTTGPGPWAGTTSSREGGRRRSSPATASSSA